MGLLSRLLKTSAGIQARRIGQKILENWQITLHHSPDSDDTAIIREIFCDRVYADYFPFYQQCTIVDVGAHKGFFSLFAHRNTHPNSKIIALEPSQKNYQALIKNLELNHVENVIPLNKGVAAKKGRLKLYLLDDKNHSIYPGYGDILHKDTVGFEEVETLAIADIITELGLNTIDFLKMDCEGAEYESLLGLDEATCAKIKTISVEFHDLKDERLNSYHLAGFLKERNFTIVRHEFLKTVARVNTGHLVAVQK